MIWFACHQTLTFWITAQLFCAATQKSTSLRHTFISNERLNKTLFFIGRNFNISKKKTIFRIKWINLIIFFWSFFQPNGDRLYEIDGHKRLMPEYVVKHLLIWNTQSNYIDSLDIDKRFVDLLLVCFIGKQKLCDNDIDLKHIRFVRGLLC